MSRMSLWQTLASRARSRQAPSSLFFLKATGMITTSIDLGTFCLSSMVRVNPPGSRFTITSEFAFEAVCGHASWNSKPRSRLVTKTLPPRCRHSVWLQESYLQVYSNGLNSKPVVKSSHILTFDNRADCLV